MAKPLNEVIASSLSSDRVTVETLENTIEQAKAATVEQQALQARAEADSIDWALNESDREEAAANADRAGRQARAYQAAVDKLTEKLAQKRESDSQKTAQAERDAALAERDGLVERWKEVPDLLNKLKLLFAATGQNTDRLRRAGITEPDAESIARGVTMLGRGGDPDSLAKMRIPAWDKAGRQWPIDHHSIAMAEMNQQITEQFREARKARSPEAIAARKAEEAKQWHSVTLSQTPYTGRVIPFTYLPRGESKMRKVNVGNQPFETEMTMFAIREAEKAGITVEPVTEKASA